MAKRSWPMDEHNYDPRAVESRWQEVWQRTRLYEVDLDGAERPLYNLMEFPYPSGEGLHVGHTYSFGGADSYGRFQRMRGFDVFQPMGFDAFGIHAENYALKLGINPAELVPQSVRRFREEQLKRMGAGFDWSRQVNTSDPAYYRWTQWIFCQLFKGGLAYRGEAPVNWCPSCLTTLAAEQVVDGRCERCHTSVGKRNLTQWFLRITDYAEQLLDFGGADFPQMTRRLQRNWIGRKLGAEIDFAVEGSGRIIPVFGTRSDTLYGATFLVLAPEHPLVAEISTDARRAMVDAYRERARRRNEAERPSTSSEKTGAFTGAIAINPVDGRRLPIWVADYATMSFGTGAVFATPAHDQRDHAFARAHGLPIVQVVRPREGLDAGETSAAAYVGGGVLINSGPYDGMDTEQAGEAIVRDLGTRGVARPSVSYRLHDWTISRQRYWGPPIPIIYCATCGEVPVPEQDLPVLLPPTDRFRPLGTGQSPLAAIDSFVRTRCPTCDGPARRETDVSDNFMDSAWYFMRYLCTEYDERPWDAERLRAWLPVDLYFGGPEHSTMHHLYARFLWKALQDLGHLPTELGPEPFTRLRLHGLIIKDGARMSKSRGNVVNPDAYVTRYGADVLRLYLLFIGPFQRGGDFRDDGIVGMVRLLNTVWRLVTSPQAPAATDAGSEPDEASDVVRAMHQAIRRVTRDIEELGFNTAIAALMSYVGALRESQGRVVKDVWQQGIRALLLLLAPFAPHVAEELWERCGWPFSVHRQRWPEWDPNLAADEARVLVVQVDGKLRERLTVRADIAEGEARKMALASESVRRALAGRAVVRTVYVPGRLVNIVTRQ